MASSITAGCSSRNTEATSCFPVNQQQDMYLISFCMYMQLGAIGLAALEVIVGCCTCLQVDFLDRRLRCFMPKEAR